MNTELLEENGCLDPGICNDEFMRRFAITELGLNYWDTQKVLHRRLDAESC